MGTATVTLGLEGEDVPADAFGNATQAFTRLIYRLTKQIDATDPLKWTVVGLNIGSATTTLEAVSSDTDALQRITADYEAVGIALKNRQPLPYSREVTKAANALARVLNGKITALRFETPREDIIVTDSRQEPVPALRHTYGAIRGRIETLSQRKRLRFTLYDSLDDRPVACYLGEGQEEMIRNLWGQRAVVEGLVSRTSDNGRPLAIRQIQTIAPIADVEPGAFTKARGIWANEPGNLSSTEAIRRIRDA
jgi:hypothetical protein